MLAAVRVNVSTTPVLLWTAINNTVVVVRPSTNFVFLGGSNGVTILNGYQLVANNSFPVTLDIGDQLWAVANGAAVVSLLVQQEQ